MPPPCPPYLREDVYQAILDAAQSMDDDALRESLIEYGYTFSEVITDTTPRERLLEDILDNPAPFLTFKVDILSRPELLVGAEFELDDELEGPTTYVITEGAADEIAEGGEYIMLHATEMDEDVPVSRERIEEAFVTGCLLDYSNS